jgi:NADH:quinone reductase (non-electrogenic)
LNNAAARQLLEKEAALGKEIKFEDIIDVVAGVYPKVMMEGKVDSGVWSYGMVAGLIHDIPTCEELLSCIMSDVEKLVRGHLERLF